MDERREYSMRTLTITFLLALAMTLAALAAACSSASEEPGENGTENEQGEQSEEHEESGESGEHDGESESGEGDDDGEESATQYGLTDTYDVVRNGARLIVAYDDSWNTFRGTVENTTGETLMNVRVEIHLSNGIELGPTPMQDLAPGEMAEITLPASKQRFETWSAHPEVGGGAEHEPVAADIESAARELLATETNADKDDFILDSSESVSWSDASLGCPQEGMAYAQVITPGHKLIFTLGDTIYAVHTNADGSNTVLCNDSE